MISSSKIRQGALSLVAAFTLLHTAVWSQDQRNLSVQAAATRAPGEKRVALVIGNSAYQRGPLKNPANDAADMAVKLRALGFDVIERKDLRMSHIGRTLREFRSRLGSGGVALFFYAGHGLQIKGENYLPAVDADIEGEEDVPNQSISVRQVLELMGDAKTRLNLAFLDACRNNPYTRSVRSGGGGLAKVSAPSGTLVSFATRPGSVAADGNGRNGLYTTHLLGAMETPNLPVEQMLKRVTSGVKNASKGNQEPWMEGSIEGDFYFRADTMPPAAAAPGTLQQEAIDKAVQEAVRLSSAKADRERADLKAAMQKLIEQALARQSSMKPASEGAPAAKPASPPTAVASSKPSPMPAAVRPLSFAGAPEPQPGDEWEYLASEEIWGKQKTLLWRVKAVVPSSGVLEEMIVDGKRIQEWAFDGKPVFVDAPIASNLIFGPHWDGSELTRLPVMGNGACVQKYWCHLDTRIAGKERVTVAAGTFDTIRIEGVIHITFPHAEVEGGGQIKLWYSEKDRHLVRQVVSFRNTRAGLFFKETVELQAARTR